jgi:alkylresorcinol/alkylpyrone synthase
VVSASITAIRHAVPGAEDHLQMWDEFFADYYRGDRLAKRIWQAAGIRTRHAVVDPRVEDASGWGTGARMQRYLTEAVPLAKEAVSAALASSGCAAESVASLTVASCTGYATPGLDILLARDLAMDEAVQRLFVGHMGCYAALPALGATADFVRCHSAAAVLLCVELPSLHIQPPGEARDVNQVIAHALFGDAAVACVLGPDVPGLEVVDVAARTDLSTVDHMTWAVTDFGFRMGLSPLVPEALARHVRPVIDELLRRHRLAVGDVRGWAIHPGGPRILEVAADRLGLDEQQMAASYATLRDYGNCSSATVLLILERLVHDGGLAPGDHIVATAFGPGLTLYAALLRVSA